MRPPAVGRTEPSASRRVLALVPLLALLLAGLVGPAGSRLGAAQTPPAANTAAKAVSREWKRAQSANFVAVGNARDEVLRDVLAQLEAFRWAFLQMFPSVRLTSPVPTIAVAFKDWDSYTKFQPRDPKGRREDAVAGYFSSAANVNYLVMGAQGEGSVVGRTIAFHELTHYILHRNLYNIPIWLDEGLAEYYSTLKIDKNRLIIGAPHAYRVQVLREVQLLPLEKVLSTQATMKLFEDDRDTDRFYAQAWALVHYLTLGNRGKRQKQIGAYVSGLQRGLSIDQAFQSAFACSYDDLERELRGYVGAYAFPALALPVPANVVAEIGAAERMTEVDAEALQADLLVRAGAHDDAEKRLSALLAREPTHTAARLSLALVRVRQERYQEAVPLLQQLVQADSNDFAAHVYLAPALVEVGQAEDAVRAAERATVLNKESPSAWWALAVAALAADRTSQADAAMTLLLRLEADPRYYQTRAYEAFRLGKDAAAARDAQAFVKQAGWGHESAPYLAFLAALAHRRTGQNEDADRVLEQARAVVERGSWTEKVLDFFQGRLAGDRLLQQAKDNGERTEAHAYIGFHDALAGHHEQALTHFRWVKERGSKDYVEYDIAVAELARLEKVSAKTS